MKLSGVEFSQGEKLPQKHGYMNENVSPALEITEVPGEASSLALVFKDPDAQEMAGKTWIHWTLWDIDPEKERIEEDTAPGIEGITDFRKKGYNGPNPPDGDHEVKFELFALNEEIELEAGADFEELEDEINDKKLDKAVLEATFLKE